MSKNIISTKEFEAISASRSSIAKTGLPGEMQELKNGMIDFSAFDIEYRASGFGEGFRRLRINTFLEPKVFEMYSITNDVSDPKNLARLLTSKDVRDFLIQFFGAMTDGNFNILNNIIKDSCASSNGTIFTDAPIAEYNLMYKAIRDHCKKANENQVSALLFILYKAFNRWNVLGVDRKVTRIYTKIKGNYSESVTTTTIMFNQLVDIADKLMIRSSELSSNRTNSNTLARLLIDSVQPFIIQLENVNRYLEAYKSCLARVKAYILNRFEAYKEDERFFVESSNFQFLATNYQIVKDALESTSFRPSASSIFWNSHDDIVANAIRTCESHIVRPISDAVRLLSTKKILNNRGRYCIGIVTKSFKNDSSFDLHYKISNGAYSQFAKFDYALEYENFVNSVCKSIDVRDTFKMVSDLTEISVNEDTPEMLFTIGVDENDLMLYAIASAQEVWLDPTSKDLLFTATLDKKLSNLQYTNIFPENVSVKDPKVFCFLTMDDHESSEVINIPSYPSLDKAVRYGSMSSVVSAFDGNKRHNIKIIISNDINTNQRFSIEKEVSLFEILNIDSGVKLVNYHQIFQSAKLNQLIDALSVMPGLKDRLYDASKTLKYDSEIRELRARLSQIDIKSLNGEEKAKAQLEYDMLDERIKHISAKRDNHKNMLKSLNGQFDLKIKIRIAKYAYQLYLQVKDTSFFKSIENLMQAYVVGYLKNNPSVAEEHNVSTGSVFVDKMIEGYISVSAFVALIQFADLDLTSEELGTLLSQLCNKVDLEVVL